VLEFGAGKSLSQNIFLSRIASHQTVVDLFDMIDISQFDDAARQISGVSDVPYRRVETLADIEANYAIRYRAPYDINQTDFADGAFDACISTNTLEHIPEESIISIFRELKRVIRPGGLISAVIDYSDHYAHTDRNISYLNFLAYSTSEFARHNHRVHFQNRLRHADFERIFNDLGFEIRRNEALNSVDLPVVVSSQFDATNPTITATKGIFLLAVPGA
jgi:SAM-dependent methyltransferase